MSQRTVKPLQKQATPGPPSDMIEVMEWTPNGQKTPQKLFIIQDGRDRPLLRLLVRREDVFGNEYWETWPDGGLNAHTESARLLQVLYEVAKELQRRNEAATTT